MTLLQTKQIFPNNCKQKDGVHQDILRIRQQYIFNTKKKKEKENLRYNWLILNLVKDIKLLVKSSYLVVVCFAVS